MTPAVALFALGIRILGIATPAPGSELALRLESLAVDVLAVEDTPQWHSTAYGTALYESGGLADPPGWNDQGRACGVLQVWEPQRWLSGATCAAVRADRRLGLRVGLLVMKRLAKDCGGVQAGLSAYATGKCPPKGKVLALVKARCAVMGCPP